MSSKILCIIFILIVLPSFIFAQSWKNSIDLNLTVDDRDRIDLYTNAEGNHVILHTSSQLKYYLFSYDGTQVRTATIDNSLSGYPRLSCISGYLDTVIVLWKEGSYIYGKRTTDAGQNWTPLSSQPLTYSYCNGLEVWPTEDELHVVWSESDSDEDGSYETYHRPLDYDGYWGTTKQVTDYSGEEGGFPSVTTSANRVHVAYTECYSTDPVGNRGTSKNRDKYNTSWQTPLEIFDDAGRSYVVATSQKLHAFYYDFAPGMGQFGYNLYHCYRDFNNSSWSSPYLILSYGADLDVNTIDMAVTSNDSLHIVYNGEYYKEYTGSWQNTYSFNNAVSTYCNKMYANSNDIYIVWIEENGEDYTLMLKQRDYAPLSPLTLAVTSSQNYHPYLTWDSNNEADLSHYEIWKKVGTEDWSILTTTSNNFYEDESESIIATWHTSPVTAYYKIKAVDYADNKSDFSDVVDIVVERPHGTPEDISNSEIPSAEITNKAQSVPGQLTFNQNYPNPFNPTTNIHFGLSENMHITINIYTVTGEKVKTLINQFFEKGYNSVEWNGTNQNGNPVSTGIYIYELIAGDQRLAKKMFLAK